MNFGSRPLAYRNAQASKARDVTLLTNLVRRRVRFLLTFVAVASLALLFWPARPLRSDNFVFYLPNGPRLVPLQTIDHTNYMPLLPLLNALGRVQGLTAARDSIKVFFEDSQLEFHVDDKKVLLKKEKISLSDPVRMQDGQWMIPVNFLETVLPRIVHQSIVYRLGSRRAFIGDVQPSSFSFRLDSLANGSRLTLQFSEKINVRTAASNGKWVLYLGDKPVQPLEQKFEFHDPYLSNIQFDDQDGAPKLIITPAVDGLNFYPKLDETGKTLMADMVKAVPVVAQQPPPSQVPETPGVTVLPPAIPSTTPTATAAGEPGLPVVVLDAGHGADDSGARGSNGLLEKDLVAQLVARVRSNLLTSRRYRIILTRVGDVNPTQDQRAAIANAAHAVVFVTFHAGNLGTHTPRVTLYTLQAPPTSSPSTGDRAQGLFVPWGTVQLSHLPRSQLFAEALQKELTAIPGASVGSPTGAPLGVLRGVNAPAVAIEIGSLNPDVDATPLSATSFQDGIANAVVRAMDAFEGER